MQATPVLRREQQGVMSSDSAAAGLDGDHAMLLGPMPDLQATIGLAGAVPMPMFPLLTDGGGAALGDVFGSYDDSLGLGPGGAGGSGMAEDDFGLWEEGFANPAGYDLAQWTEAAQMAVDRGV